VIGSEPDRQGRNDVTALGPRQALIKGIAIAKIRRNWIMDDVVIRGLSV
jgi:hypothetical protein